MTCVSNLQNNLVCTLNKLAVCTSLLNTLLSKDYEKASKEGSTAVEAAQELVKNIDALMHLPKAYCDFRPDDGADLSKRLEEFPFGDLPVWQVCQVWERLAGVKTVATLMVLIPHIREALSLRECLWADAEPSLN